MKSALVDWITSSDQPFSEVENEEFRKFVTSLNPMAQIPTRKTLKKWILELYLDKKDKLINLIQVVPFSKY